MFLTNFQNDHLLKLKTFLPILTTHMHSNQWRSDTGDSVKYQPWLLLTVVFLVVAVIAVPVVLLVFGMVVAAAIAAMAVLVEHVVVVVKVTVIALDEVVAMLASASVQVILPAGELKARAVVVFSMAKVVAESVATVVVFVTIVVAVAGNVVGVVVDVVNIFVI